MCLGLRWVYLSCQHTQKETLIPCRRYNDQPEGHCGRLDYPYTNLVEFPLLCPECFRREEDRIRLRWEIKIIGSCLGIDDAEKRLKDDANLGEEQRENIMDQVEILKDVREGHEKKLKAEIGKFRKHRRVWADG